MGIDDVTLPRLTEAYRNRYYDKGHWRDETLVDLFDEAVAERPESTIVGPNRTVTYRELEDEVRRVSAALQELGIEAGDVVSYQLPNWVESCVVHLAVANVGAVANPIIPIYRESEVSYILGDSDAKCVVVPAEYRGFDYPEMIAELAPDLPALETVVTVGGEADGHESVDTRTYDDMAATSAEGYDRPEMGADDIHALLYTSGTTGDPKGVLHTHNTTLFELRKTVEILGLSHETTVFMPSPVTHVTGMLYALELPYTHGMDLVLMDEWDAAEAVDLVETHDCNMTVGATPFLQGMCDEVPDDWSSPLRFFGCGGAEVPPDLVRRATDRLDCTVQRVYGSTEFPTATWSPLDAPLEKAAETDGLPAPEVSVEIVDIETGERLPPGEKGELVAHGPELMVGYLGDELNEAAFDGEWFETGDLAILDEDGYVEIAGRKKDIIIRGGENIPVKDVEDRLYEHPAIEEVAIVAMPDPEMQEKGCAYVKVKEGHEFTLEDMTEYLDQEGIAKQKYPERLEIVDELPMTASGKIQKNVLRDRIADELGMEPVTR
ncbi:AMP-binding protein [Halorientalis marina]|uniref:AMP-binding protein n=1 Tax=Halorientalis marina TaxID=2931976 RepID=UPI001FF290CD|nr:AMP-binding protein [Halorientalis marina]